MYFTLKSFTINLQINRFSLCICTLSEAIKKRKTWEIDTKAGEGWVVWLISNPQNKTIKSLSFVLSHWMSKQCVCCCWLIDECKNVNNIRHNKIDLSLAQLSSHLFISFYYFRFWKKRNKVRGVVQFSNFHLLSALAQTSWGAINCADWR